MFSKIKEKIVGDNRGEFHKTAYKNLEKNETTKQKMLGGNDGEFHKIAYKNLYASK